MIPSIQTNTVMPSSSATSASAIMVQAEIMLARDFDQQIRSLADRIQFLGKVRREYLKNIGEVTTFLAKNSNTSRKDGKRYIEASFSEMENLSANFVSYDLNRDDLKLVPKSMDLNDNGDKQKAVTSEDSRSSFADWQAFFAEGAALKDPQKAKTHAEKISDDNGELPFYFGHTNNTFENGEPKIAVFVEGLEKFVELMRNKMSEAQEKSEQLSVNLDRLMQQRKSALEGAHQILAKIEQTKNQALSTA